MSKPQIVLILALAMWVGIFTFEFQAHRPIILIAPMPADGSAPPLPPPIEIGPGRFAINQ